MNALLDILLLGLAVFAVWRLYSAFGKNTGLENSDKPLASKLLEEGSPAAEVLAKARSQDGRVRSPLLDKIMNNKDEIAVDARSSLTLIQQRNKNFTTKDFFKGARIAYKMIVEAFAKGDMEVLKKLLHVNVAERFQAEIERRKHQKHEANVEVRSISVAKIIKASAPETELGDVQITIQMESQQLAWTKDEEGRIIAGDPNTLRDMKDIWTFVKKLNSPNPNWLLVATGK